MKQVLLTLSHWRKALSSWLLVGAIVLGLQVLATPALATGAYSIPDLTSDTPRVLDQAEVLSRLSESKINSDLSKLAQETGQEVHFVTIHRLDYDETAETFAEQLFQKWFPTPERQANQTLLVIDNVTNTTAIRTGAQVKQRMSEAIARSVAQETVLVPLKEGEKYNQAFVAASDRLVAVLSGQPDPGPPQVKDNVQTEGTFATPEETKKSNAMVWVLGLLAAATIIPMATYYFYQSIQS